MLKANRLESWGALVGIDLDLDPKGHSRCSRRAPIDLWMLPDAGPDVEPQAGSQTRECLRQRTDPGCRGPHIVEILAVAVGPIEMEFVQGRPTPEDEFGTQVVIVRDRTDCP